MPQQLSAALAIAALALVARLITGPSGLDADAIQALYWGREIAHGHLPVYHAHFGVVPHPLLIAFATLCALAKSSAVTAFASMYYLSVGAIMWGAFRLGKAVASPIAGVTAVFLLLTSSALLLTTGLGYVDVPFAALVVWAAVLELESPKRGRRVLVILGLAGLLRPEAWVLSGLYWAYVSRGRSASGSRALLAAVTLAAPLLWTASDWVISGDPFVSLQTAHYYGRTQHTAALSLDAHGIWTALRSFLGVSAVVGGALGMLLAAWKRDRAALTVAAVALVGFLLETATSILGLQVQPRYLAYVSVGLAVLAGYAVAHVSGFRRSAGMAGRCLAAAAAALLLWFALSVPVRIAGIEATRGQLRGHAAVIAQLQALSDQPATLKSLRSCRHMTAEWAYLATILGYTAYVPAASMPANWSLPSGRSVALLVEANVPAHWPQRLIPTGFQQRGAVSDFALYTRDC